MTEVDGFVLFRSDTGLLHCHFTIELCWRGKVSFFPIRKDFFHSALLMERQRGEEFVFLSNWKEGFCAVISKELVYVMSSRPRPSPNMFKIKDPVYTVQLQICMLNKTVIDKPTGGT